MDILVISVVAFLASGLTLFSGFGLGTLLMPVVALFFSVDVAIAMTAMVHLANNLFKVVLLGKDANRAVLWRFGTSAVLFAFLGALVLGWLSGAAPVFAYTVFGRLFQVFPIKLVVGVLVLMFVLLELSSWFASLELDRKYLPLGGMVSGFFGGLSGHQGAFRSMFLLKAGLSKEEFVATGVVLAVLVDTSRMFVYGWGMIGQQHGIRWTLIIVASLSAFLGAYLGAKWLQKVTIRSIQLAVSALLILLALGMIAGVL
ncbi:sulfite exporter TauE/SafE family protein [Myxococcota bacterium]|nr:sulfite exporter TauE/SafE family protein [Myxococcota bacterium]